MARIRGEDATTLIPMPMCAIPGCGGVASRVFFGFSLCRRCWDEAKDIIRPDEAYQSPQMFLYRCLANRIASRRERGA